MSSFESWPLTIKQYCGLASSVGDAHQCYPHRGWHVNHEFNIDSTGTNGRVPAGLKFTMQTWIRVEAMHGGRLFLKHRMTGFNGGKVYFRVLLNGQLMHISNENTIK